MSHLNLSNFPQPQLQTPIPTMAYHSQPLVQPPIQAQLPPEISTVKITPSNQPPPQSPTFTLSAPAGSSQHPDQQMYKNRLQELTQKLNIPLPRYETINEGFPHAPKFRSTVLVDGMKFTSPKTFWTRKAAEKYVAELALKHVSQRKTEEDLSQDLSLINEETVFCKSILHEFASKMSLDIPTYSTVKSEGLLLTFRSSLVFNGIPYTGRAGKNKKEAEQLAARAVIMSLLDTPTMGKVLREIIKSKGKLYATLQNVNNPTTTVPLPINTAHISAFVHGTGLGNEVCIPLKNAPAPITVDSLPKVVNNAVTGIVPVGNITPNHELNAVAGVVPIRNVPPNHEFKKPEEKPFQATMLPEPVSSQMVNLPVEFVHPVSALPVDVCAGSSKRRRKNKKKANKRLCLGAEFTMDNVALNQAPPCSVALTM